MATSGTYFIDTTTFTTATSVWLNASLTILAPDGFYAINGSYRQQVNGILLEETVCDPTPTPTPTPTPNCEFDVDIDNLTTPTPTPTSTPTPTPTPNCEFNVDIDNLTTPTPTPTSTPTPTPTPNCEFNVDIDNLTTPTPTNTPTPTPTSTPTNTPTPTPTSTPTNTPTPTPTSTPIPPPTANVSQGNISCYGGSNGSITVSSPSGGSGSGYTYSKDGTNYQSSGTFNSLTAGSYNVYIKDGNGRVNYLTTITITQPTEQISTITVNTFASCNGSADGEITLSSSGGTFPKTYRLFADTTAPYNTCGDLIGTYTNVTSGSPSVSVTGIDEFGYCMEVTDANGCVTNSGVVNTTSCTGTCYTLEIPPSMLTYNGETLYIMYRKTDTTYVSEPYSSFPIEFLPDNDNYIINICSTQNPTFRYGNSGVGILVEAFTVTTNGKCDNSEWCGGADPYIPPPPTPTPPTGGYFCRDNASSPCIEQINPCSNGQTSCDQFEAIQ